MASSGTFREALALEAEESKAKPHPGWPKKIISGFELGKVTRSKTWPWPYFVFKLHRKNNAVIVVF